MEAEGKVLDFGIRNIDDAECALAIGSYEVIGSRFIQDACISAAGLEFHDDIAGMIEVSCIHAFFSRIVSSGRSDLDSNFLFLQEVFDTVDVTICLGYDSKFCRIERSGEEDLVCSFLRCCHAGCRHVHFLGLQSRDQAVKCHVLEFDFPVHVLSNSTDDVDFISCIILAVLGFEFKRHVCCVRCYLQRFQTFR